MEQIKKYIRGNSERGSEVIAELEKLGGKNTLKLKGNEYDKVYYIARCGYAEPNTIDIVSEKSFIGQLIVTHPEWEEIELPKYKYPKTYEECCKVMNYCYNPKAVKTIHKEELIRKFQLLLLYRDAYWKLYGEEMGLGKPWEPDWTNEEWPDMAYINYDGKSIDKENGFPCCNMIFIFPTEEMRDAFYENFKNEIEQCKELL